MDMALESTNQRGRYQIYVIIIVIFLPFTTYIIAAGYPYLTNPPEIYCKLKTESIYIKCDIYEYCKNENNYDMKIDYKNSLDNIALKYNLYCKRKKLSPFLNSSFFFGAVFGVAICANYPDKIGRIPVLKFLMIINIIAQINYFFNLSFGHIMFIAFFSGFTTYCNSVLSLLIVETMDHTWSALVMSARSASYGFVGIVLAFYFMTVNNLNLLLFLNIIISVLLYFLVKNNFVESARWLNSKNRIKEAIDALAKMAEINNSKEQFNMFLNVNKEMLESNVKEIEEVKTNYNIIQIFHMKSQQKYIYNLMYVWFFVAICFFGNFTALNQNKGNIFIKSILTYLGEVISEMSSGILANQYGRITVTEILSYLGGFAFTFSYFLEDGTLTKNLILFLSAFGFAGSLNLLFIYTNELFPLSIKALTFGLMFLMSRAGGVCVPFFLNNSFYPIILGMLSISCGYIMGKLPETLGKKLLDDVPEAIRHYSVLSLAPIDHENLKLIKMSFVGNDSGINHEIFKLSFEKEKDKYFSDKF